MSKITKEISHEITKRNLSPGSAIRHAEEYRSKMAELGWSTKTIETPKAEVYGNFVNLRIVFARTEEFEIYP